MVSFRDMFVEGTEQFRLSEAGRLGGWAVRLGG